MEFFSFKKNHAIGLAVALLVFTLLGSLFALDLFETTELGSVDFRFYLRNPMEKPEKLQKGVKSMVVNNRARKDIIIIGIDEMTLREFADEGIIWPFPWNVHAKFTRYISSGMPNSIFYDIMFIDHKEHEDKLAEAIKSAGNVYLDYPMETESVGLDVKDISERMELMNQTRWKADPNDRTDDLVDEALPPTPELIKAAKGIGFANVFPNTIDNINRTMPLILKFKGWYYPNIDLMIVMHYFGIDKKDVEIKWGQYIALKNLPKNKMSKPNPEREIRIPINEKGMMNINFIGGLGSFRDISYRYFYRDGSMEGNDSVKDSILLVAAYAATGIARDEKHSPYGATFGIEHHANALNTILNQDFLYQFSKQQNLILMLAIALIMGLLIPRLSIILSMAFSIISMLAYIIISYVMFDAISLVVAVSTPSIQIALSFTSITTYRLFTEQKEKRHIRQTFSKFVSKAVVDDLLKHPEKVKLGGDKMDITVIFSDIRGFTTISEKLTPEKLVEHLNEYLQSMTDIIIKYDGTLDKYIGDAIMAFWGAPIPNKDHALMACRAAVEMMTELKSLNLKWANENKPPLEIGIGLNSGDMVAGLMGSGSRMDYTLMGDNVNLGSRLEGTNKIYHTNIIMSEYTYSHVKDQVVARELDLIKVKGKEKPVKIYELLDMI
jgi:adenylate cyclase